MRFCDFFIEYKIGLKNTKSTIPWTKLPLYRKLFIILTFVIGASAILLGLLKLIIGTYVCIGLFILLFVLFAIIDSKKNNLRQMLDNHYSVYSKNRINMLTEALNKYNVNVTNTTAIDLLIESAKNAKYNNNPFLPIKKPLKTLGSIIIPIVIYVAKLITDNSSVNESLYMALISIAIILCIASIIFALVPVFKDIFYSDDSIYDDLIYDLTQLKIFNH